MINEMRMKNVWKIELRSPNKLSYDKIKKYLESKDVKLKPLRGKFDTYYITEKLQVEFGVDCMFIGANGDFNAFNGAKYVFEEIVSKDFPFSNKRQVRTDLRGDEYVSEGIDFSLTYANEVRNKNK